MTLPPIPSVRDDVQAILERLGVEAAAYRGGNMPTKSPVTGEVVAEVTAASTTSAMAAPAKTIMRTHRSLILLAR